jgi:hypothetical protein
VGILRGDPLRYSLVLFGSDAPCCSDAPSPRPIREAFAMIQCSECEHYHAGAEGVARFTCHPFTSIKEPECLAKWQLLKEEHLNQRVMLLADKLDAMTRRVDLLVQAYQEMQRIYQRLAPMQEKMFRHMEREIDDIDDADSWKRGYDENGDEDKSDDDFLNNDFPI